MDQIQLNFDSRVSIGERVTRMLPQVALEKFALQVYGHSSGRLLLLNRRFRLDVLDANKEFVDFRLTVYSLVKKPDYMQNAIDLGLDVLRALDLYFKYTQFVLSLTSSYWDVGKRVHVRVGSRELRDYYPLSVDLRLTRDLNQTFSLEVVPTWLDTLRLWRN